MYYKLGDQSPLDLQGRHLFCSKRYFRRTRTSLFVSLFLEYYSVSSDPWIPRTGFGKDMRTFVMKLTRNRLLPHLRNTFSRRSGSVSRRLLCESSANYYGAAIFLLSFAIFVAPSFSVSFGRGNKGGKGQLRSV